MMYKLSIIVLLLVSVDVELTTADCATLIELCTHMWCQVPPLFCKAVYALHPYFPCQRCGTAVK